MILTDESPVSSGGASAREATAEGDGVKASPTSMA